MFTTMTTIIHALMDRNVLIVAVDIAMTKIAELMEIIQYVRGEWD
jgi:hypothetical protein